MRRLDPERLREQARTIRREAEEKLRGWRRDRVRCLLAGVQAEEPLDPGLVADAWEILHEHFHNVYHKLNVLWRRVTLAGVGLSAVLGVFLLHAGLGPPLSQIGGHEFSLLVRVVLLGAMGALVSVMVPSATENPSARIPDQLTGQANALVRPAIGAAVAVVACFALHVGLVNPFGKGLEGQHYLFIAFVAGFSDRVVIRLVESYAQRMEARGRKGEGEVGAGPEGAPASEAEGLEAEAARSRGRPSPAPANEAPETSAAGAKPEPRS